MSVSNRTLDRIIEKIPASLWFLLTAIAASIIIYMGTRPGNELHVSNLPRGFDKVMHFTAYAAMTVCLFRGLFPVSIKKPTLIASPWCWLAILALPAAVGLLDEVLQGFTPGRSSDPWDWVADSMAGVFVLVLGVIYRRKK